MVGLIVVMVIVVEVYSDSGGYFMLIILVKIGEVSTKNDFIYQNV